MRYHKQMTSETKHNPASNASEFSVSEISLAVKKMVEGSFGHVRVRGELGRISIPASGHVYLDLKDEKAVLAAVIWKGVAKTIPLHPEQGMEVICTGKITTYGGQSKYQLVIEHMELAGVGAMMALLEKRKKALAAEGLFDADRKKPLPFLPKTIAVITSPSGAVIEDILHRISERFPCRVLIAPVPVQGKECAKRVAEALRYLQGEKPDLIIIARGGGSLEDLWGFNEEEVVRAIFESAIPVISAIGHETDVTLADFVADRRAPTPSAAAEMAVPVREELRSQLLAIAGRLFANLNHILQNRAQRLQAVKKALPKADTLFAAHMQKLDMLSLRLQNTLTQRVSYLERCQERAQSLHKQMRNAAKKLHEKKKGALGSLTKQLQLVSHKSIMARGFIFATDGGGGLVRLRGQTKTGQELTLHFADGETGAIVKGGK